MPHLNMLTAKLREIFQIDQADLDFGIYRTLNSKSKEIEHYLSHALPQSIQAAFAGSNAAAVQQWEKELAEAEAQAESLGMPSENVPKVRDLQNKIAAAKSSSSESEAAVYNHLLAFFSRYYESGDFISQRRYKGNTYAVPYNGEEVLLHWANKDQYYTKSGENFSNYRFTLSDGRQVFFRLAAADTAKDNQKGSRIFALAGYRAPEYDEESGEEIRAEVLPVCQSEDGNTLEIRFDYRLAEDKAKQNTFNDQTIEALFADSIVQNGWIDALSERAPTEKNPARTLLEKHLADYTQKNSADYFIHKDLGGFLTRELDFYIKNEVMQLDDIANAAAFADLENNFRLIQTLRQIGSDIIGFLAQLENFQKKLWLKKKFVAAAHYLITLNHIPAEMLEQVFANARQLEQWQNLFAFKELPPPRDLISFAESNPYLIVDTSLFAPEFQAALISELSSSPKLSDGIDAATDGVLIHADNFQALNLLQARYRGQVKCIYIDPPYNTNSSEILYKNSYKHSSWLSLMHNRITLSRNLQLDKSFIFVAIDDLELFKLNELMVDIYGEENFIANISVIHKPEGRNQEKFFGTSNEFMLVYAENKQKANFYKVILDEEIKEQFNLIDKNGSYKRKNFIRLSDGKYALRESKPDFYYPIYVDKNLQRIDIEPFDNSEIVYPVTNNGIERTWKTKPNTLMEYYSQGNIEAIHEDEGIVIYEKLRENQVIKTHWSKKDYHAYHFGTKLLENILGTKDFTFPKSIATVFDTLKLCTQNKELVLDYFAGSGTTAHAVINLNREDGGKRKYILVEQGEYFDTVLKPRVQKVIYAENWKDGKPVPSEKASEQSSDLFSDGISRFNGVSQIVKVLKLESYEDTLNNLELSLPKGVHEDWLKKQPESLQKDYLLHYMLDAESRSSLLSTDDFIKPFNYRLKIAADSAGAFAEQRIDLVETFNYLLGLRVDSVDDQRFKRGFVFVEGRLPDGAKTLIVWRDCEKYDYEGLEELLRKRQITPQNNEFAVVYINGDHNTATAWAETSGVLKIRQTEAEFLRLMFAEEA